MDNKIDGLATIQLDRERHLLLSLNAMIAFKKETGKELLAGLKVEDMSIEDLRAFIWACLRHEDKELTLEAVGDFIHVGNLEYVTAKMLEAWNKAMPEASDPLVKSPQSL